MLDRQVTIRLLSGRDHYDQLIDKALRQAQVAVWIATANVKDLHVAAPLGTRARSRRRYVSFLTLLDSLAERQVELRLLHGATASNNFRKSLPRFARLADGALQLRHCPRVHLKMMAIDGSLLYLGSANLTGAGLGAKAEHRRNFEAGILTDDDLLLDQMQEQFEAIWSGRHCQRCGLRRHCERPLDQSPLPPAVQ